MEHNNFIHCDIGGIGATASNNDDLKPQLSVNKLVQCSTCGNGYNKLFLHLNASDHDESIIIHNFNWLRQKSSDYDLQHIMQHIYDGTLSEHHEALMNLYFPLVVASTTENINLWIEMYGIPKTRFLLQIRIPKENLIYILERGYDPNNFHPLHLVKPISDFESEFMITEMSDAEKKYMVPGMNDVEMIKLLINYGYRVTPYRRTFGASEKTLYFISDAQKFKELSDQTTFTTEDAKELIADNLHYVIRRTPHEQRAQIIAYLTNKYDLQEYVENLPEMQWIMQFRKMLGLNN